MESRIGLTFDSMESPDDMKQKLVKWREESRKYYEVLCTAPLSEIPRLFAEQAARIEILIDYIEGKNS